MPNGTTSFGPYNDLYLWSFWHTVKDKPFVTTTMTTNRIMETTKLHSGMPITKPPNKGSNPYLEDLFDDNAKVFNDTLPTLSSIVDTTKTNPRFL